MINFYNFQYRGERGKGLVKEYKTWSKAVDVELKSDKSAPKRAPLESVLSKNQDNPDTDLVVPQSTSI